MEPPLVEIKPSKHQSFIENIPMRETPKLNTSQHNITTVSTLVSQSVSEQNVPKHLDPIVRCNTPNNSTISGKLSTQYSASKSYSSAMKALQERVKQLERENEHLTSKVTIVDKKLETEQGKAKDKIIKEMSQWEVVERQLKEEINNLTKENIVIKEELINFKKEKEFMGKQIQQLTKEKERHLEQNSIERDQWRKEKEKQSTQLVEADAKIKQMKKENEII